MISYEYPNYHWEKDNYRVRPEYRDLVREVLGRLASNQGPQHSGVPLASASAVPAIIAIDASGVSASRLVPVVTLAGPWT